MANCGDCPAMPKATTHNGEVSIPRPPPKPALLKPMNTTAKPTNRMTGHSVTQVVYGSHCTLSMGECVRGYSGERAAVLTRDTVCNLDRGRWRCYTIQSHYMWLSAKEV